ncbi:DUF971 domain-containing protein [Thauera butanivorans]|uniref:DUF971 domain-containing protein n=1 Tax=Thauera butanivorans TaxID=86174 RepID=UPI000839930C|nr:DUF971 domain-containing protein [Thauera butanivorans]
MNATTTSSCLPVQITDRRRSGLLVIEWSDGASSVLHHGRLRQQCRCAACTQRRRSGQAPAAPAALADIRPVADKGLNLVFADGHDRGIYPWAYLRELGDERA